MAMGLSMGTSANELIGRCSCCHTLSTNPRLTKTLRSPHQSQNFSTFRVPSLHLRRSEFPRKPSKCPMNALGSSSSSSDSNSNDESPSSSQSSEDGSSTGRLPSRRLSSSPGSEKPNPAQSALARALAYKNAKETPGSSLKSQQVDKPSAPERPKNTPEVDIVRGQSFQSRLQSADASSAPEMSSLPSFSSSSLTSPAGGDTPSNSGEFRVTPSGAESELQGTSQGPKTPTLEGPKYVEDKLEAVSKTESDPVQGKRGVGETPPEAKKKESTISLDAFKKAQAYKQQQAEMIAALKGKPDQPPASSNSSNRTTDSKSSVAGENLVEVEIVTRDGVMKKLVNPEKAFSNVKEFKRTGVSSIDFAGLGFADKKQGGRTVVREDYQPPPPGTLPEVEIITKDAGTGTAGDSEDSDLYKPKVSTWGLFPRPADISKAYGGGRTIRPGEPLETEEERISREAKTQKLLADYKKKMGLDIDPRVKSECEKLFKQGNSLMESGDLRAALALFENVMEKMVFQSELHGAAALQGAICLDSLARFSEAKEVYEKLISHPSGKIRKQAKQLLYGFRAMENLKVSTGNKWDTSVYAKYFEAFADGYSNIYKATEDETSENLIEQTIAYSLLLFVPILLVVILVLHKNSAS